MRNPAKTYRDFLVWQKAVDAAGLIYRITKDFPQTELYGLTAQLRRCAVSVPSNIAEGFGRRGQAEFLRFLLISRGSIFELETQILVALNVGIMQKCAYRELAAACDEVERMLESLIRSVRQKK